MTRHTRSDRKASLEFAVRFLETKLSAVDKRYELFNQKLNFHLTVLALLGSVLAIVVPISLTQAGPFFANSLTQRCELQSIVVLALTGLFAASLVVVLMTLFLIVAKILKALSPITITEPDEQSVEVASRKGYLAGMATLRLDLQHSLKHNMEAVNRKYNDLFAIRRFFVAFLCSYFVMIVTLLAAVVLMTYQVV